MSTENTELSYFFQYFILSVGGVILKSFHKSIEGHTQSSGNELGST